jgi:hypothetical protein
MLTSRTIAGPAKIDSELPVWLAALVANACEAVHGARGHSIHWICRSGEALYTNSLGTEEWIQPLGVCLREGETLAVSWQPGETEYTLDVYSAGPAADCSQRAA